MSQRDDMIEAVAKQYRDAALRASGACHSWEYYLDWAEKTLAPFLPAEDGTPAGMERVPEIHPPNSVFTRYAHFIGPLSPL